ncbi:MAG TPA: adenylate/guanylate cyclase domain-containing protein [Phycisphaerae bacterium]|nr:adenylate/guanylate cyclase domain-containing protein [Phycisphaerae bacterium]
MGSVTYKFASLQDYVLSFPLSVEGTVDDGWGANVVVKGVETVAAILFADISGFTRRTSELSSTETLIFVNNFLSWITAEALKGGPGIVDKYIGDEIMVVFSQDFGSEDPFLDALNAARWMAERDELEFCPRIGIAYGPVTCGIVGTPLKYDCSVFGIPVTMAKRCASEAGPSSIVFPESAWRNRSFADIFKPRTYETPDGKTAEMFLPWELCPSYKAVLKNLPETELRKIHKSISQREPGMVLVHYQPLSAEDRARESLGLLRDAGLYRPRQIISAPP